VKTVKMAEARGSRRVLVLVATLSTFLLVGGAVVFVVYFLGPLVEDRVKEEARKRGVEMVWTKMSFYVTSASFEGVRFRLVGVPQIEATARTIDVSVSGYEPKNIEAEGVNVTATGSAADLTLAVTAWAAAHPQAFKIPVSAHDVSVSYLQAPGTAPWLTVTGGAMSDNASGVTFSAPRAVVSGIDVGAVAAAWTAEAASVTMGFGAADPKTAPIHVTVNHAATPKTASVVLLPTELSKLSGPLAVPLPVKGVTVSGQVDLTFKGELDDGPISGELSSKLVGWIPPHPVELDGFLFGNTTTFTSHLEIDATRKVVDLSNSRVKAGAFELVGGGRIERDDVHASISMNLSGNLPCAAVAESAAAAHLGSFLSDLVGSAARKIVDGSVGVRVKLAADSRNLDAATVLPTIGIGCGITPLRGVDTEALKQLPKKLQDIAKRLPALPALPDLPVFR
jgi:hypothetical protein